MKINAPEQSFIEAATNLNEDEIERLINRNFGKLTSEWRTPKMDTLQALAFQLETEAEELADWREKMIEINEIEKNKKKS